MALTIQHKFVSPKAEQSDTTLVGPNEWNATHNVTDSAQLYWNVDYMFPAIAPGGTLMAGVTNIVTLANVPPGVNGSDANHYLYISGGTGTAESVLITGGTAVAGGTNQTITFTPAFSHSGAWNIQSATAGIQEAISAFGGNNNVVYVKAGAFSIFAPIRVNGSAVFIKGQGLDATTLFTIPIDSNNIFEWINPTSGAVVGGGLSDLSISCPNSSGNPTKTGGWAVVMTNQQYFSIRDVAIYFCTNGIQVNNSGHLIDTVSIISLAPTVGVGLQVNGTGAPYNFFNNVYVAGDNGQACMQILNATYITVLNCNLTGTNYGLSLTPGSTQSITSFDVIGTYFDNNLINSIFIQPQSGGYLGRSRFTHCWTSSAHSGNGLVISNAGTGTVDGLSFINHQAILNFNDGVNINGTSAGAVKNILFDGLFAGENNASNTGTGGVSIGLVSNVQITNSIIGAYGTPGVPNNQAYGIKITGAFVDNLVVTGNNLLGNTVPIIDSSGSIRKVITNNLGVDTATPPTIASASVISLGTTDQPIYYVTGTTTITNINVVWIGRIITLVKTDAGTLTIGGAGNVPGVHTLTQNSSVRLTFDGTNWY